MIPCKSCGIRKAGQHFPLQDDGQRSLVCKKCSGMPMKTSVKTAKKVALVTSEPKPVKLNGHLEIAAGLGVRASIEDGTLQLEQDRVDADDGETYTHSISLSPGEARQVVDWIAQQVEAA
jgi:hypothetical protein